MNISGLRAAISSLGLTDFLSHIEGIMLPLHVALVSETASLSLANLLPASAALQKQVTRDFGPLWSIEATVGAYAKLEDVPLDYWPVIIRDDIQTPGAAGVHEDNNGQPFALVQFSNQWSLTTSHEVLEMLADPFGRRMVAGQSPKSGQGRVQFLVEVCDPSEDSQFSYTVNGVMVSDFYTPKFFDPVTSPGVQYSFTGAIKEPRQVLKGGYLSWFHPPTKHFWQETFFSGTKPTFRDLGKLTASGQSFRSQVDRLTPRPETVKGLPAKNKILAAVTEVSEAQDEATAARAAALKQQIQAIVAAPA
jgi:hypothetical protein